IASLRATSMNQGVELAGRHTERRSPECSVDLVPHKGIMRRGGIHVAPDTLEVDGIVDRAPAARLIETVNGVAALVHRIGDIAHIARTIEARRQDSVLRAV